MVAGREVLVGNRRLLGNAGIDLSIAAGRSPTGSPADGKTPILAAIDGRPAGVIGCGRHGQG